MIDHQPNLAKLQTSGLLEAVCQALELSRSQFEIAEQRYKGVGEWLSETNHPILSTAEILPQGSMALGTTVRPLDRDEFDVDLVCHVVARPELRPEELKRIVGNRLKDNRHYAPLLSDEKPRCWRLDYANEFHMDITPSIPNSASTSNGVLVPDKTLGAWKESNPRGYKSWFETHAAVIPDIKAFRLGFAENRADIDDLPQPTRLRGPLRRIVQICKRHRDVWSRRESIDEPPISVILTTLAAKSFYYSVTTMSFDTELDLVTTVIERMPEFIRFSTDPSGRNTYFIPNETTPGENFAERWNERPALAENFVSWHRAAMGEIPHLAFVRGLDQVEESLAYSFGEHSARKALSIAEQSLSQARSKGTLGASAGLGLTNVETARGSVRPNTFYGR